MTIKKITILINYYHIYHRYRLNTLIEDNTGDMYITIFGRAAQALIKKSCSTLTIDEGFTKSSIIPPTIAQLRGQKKKKRIPQMTSVV